MRSFTDYVQGKNLDALISEIAHRMVELNVDPWNFLMEYYKKDSKVLMALEANKEVAINEGLWDGIKRFGQSLWQGAQTAGRELGQAAKAAGTGIARGAQTVRAGVMGPEAHYAASVEALRGLSKELNKNQAVQNAMNDQEVGHNYKKLIGDLQGILKQLDQQKPLIDNLLKFQPGQGQYTAAQNTIGSNPKAQVPGATPAGTQPQPQTKQFPVGFAGGAASATSP